MSDTALTIGFTDPPRQAARAFRVLLNAMARPGRLYALEGTDAPLPLSGPPP
jgi:alpha-D-ribose 1-methylphosphonate 5-triphosphate synthase subunit PhnH